MADRTVACNLGNKLVPFFHSPKIILSTTCCGLFPSVSKVLFSGRNYASWLHQPALFPSTAREALLSICRRGESAGAAPSRPVRIRKQKCVPPPSVRLSAPIGVRQNRNCLTSWRVQPWILRPASDIVTNVWPEITSLHWKIVNNCDTVACNLT